MAAQAEGTDLGHQAFDTVADFEAAARAKLPQPMWDVLFGDYGAERWRSTSNNVDAFNDVKLKARVLVDVSKRSLATTLLGTPVSMPIMIAPSGAHQRYHADGELATARAADSAGIIMVLSTVSTYSIEEVAAVTTGPLWFQLYMYKDRRISAKLVERAQQAGYKAIVLTVSTPGTESRERAVAFPTYNFSREFEYVPTIDPQRVQINLRDLAGPASKLPDQPGVQWHGSSVHFDDTLTWADLESLRSLTDLPIVVKGIQCGEDARLARECGVDGIVVSNHGGFAMHNARGTLEVLPDVVAEAGETEVYLDGGVRRGGDVLKALALGARAVMVGRAQAWGLTVAGEEGVAEVLDILRLELTQAMKYCGLTDVTAAGRALIA